MELFVFARKLALSGLVINKQKFKTFFLIYNNLTNRVYFGAEVKFSALNINLKNSYL